MSVIDRRPSVSRGLPLALALLALLPSGAPAKDAKPVLRLTAFAVNMTGVGRGGAGTLQIVIERWSTEAERTALINTLVESGSDKLLDAVQKIKPRAGFIRTNTSLGWDIQYARMTEIEGGSKRIVFATDRPMSFYEARNDTRSSDYEFMLCEMRIGAEGKGEGKLAVSAKISYDKDKKSVEIENYGQEPVRLTQVTVDK
ncbi:MAG TPA: hypothetical protein VMV21_02285 [Vicinamibacteria bacterium]|nr:hypothetical protein [Vicinamibacteria bacterium]